MAPGPWSCAWSWGVSVLLSPHQNQVCFEQVLLGWSWDLWSWLAWRPAIQHCPRSRIGRDLAQGQGCRSWVHAGGGPCSLCRAALHRVLGCSSMTSEDGNSSKQTPGHGGLPPAS